MIVDDGRPANRGRIELAGLCLAGPAEPLAELSAGLFMRGRMKSTGDLGRTMRMPTLFDIPRP